LGIDYWFEEKKDQNGDTVFMVKGMDGIWYRLIYCQHDPPHPKTHPTIFNKDNFRRRLTRTLPTKEDKS
jgi:hypothetical protein